MGQITEVECYNWGVNSPYKWAGAATNSPARGTTKGGFVMLPDSTPGGDAVKRCSKCGEEKPLDEFYNSSIHAGGKYPSCKACKDGRGGSRPRDARQKLIDSGFCSCTGCGQIKPISQFGRRKDRGENAYVSRCRECQVQDALSWSKRNPERHREHVARSALKRQGADPRTIDRNFIWNRDQGRCHLCRKKVNRKHWHLDHLLPLILGGEHSEDNVAVACPHCNLSRRHTGPAQMRLIKD